MNKSGQEILGKLGIKHLNKMQVAAQKSIASASDTLLLSPTGSGKTVAFLLPIFELLESEKEGIQALVLVPSRELALQIEQVARQMGTGFKIAAFYGGRSFNKDRIDLKHPPALLIGTPGRIADHMRRHTFEVAGIETLVLDEFDKSLEIGFEEDMKGILNSLGGLKRKVLTSATFGIEIPEFITLSGLKTIDFLEEGDSQLATVLLDSPTKDKLDTLGKLLQSQNGNGIIFCNYKDSIAYVSDYLERENIPHGCFHGGMEQQDRERTLIKFRNGSHRLILATDLAARGLDIPELSFIVHYQLPIKEEEFTHRNGRTARMNQKGTAFIINHAKNGKPHYITHLADSPIPEASPQNPIEWTTIFISGGRKDKISKGDIAGYFMKVGQLPKEDLGLIELKVDCAFVAVKKEKAANIVNQLSNQKLKNKKVRLSII